jgi:hypothetical protein
MRLFICYLNLLALEVTERSGNCQSSEDSAENDEPTLALNPFLFILTGGFVVD